MASKTSKPDDASTENDNQSDADNIWIAADDAGILIADGGVDVGYDASTTTALKEDFWMTGSELAQIEQPSPSGYNVPMDVWYEGEKTSYEDLTGERASPTPTTREKAEARQTALTNLGLERWCEMSREEREHLMLDIMAGLLHEVAGDF